MNDQPIIAYRNNAALPGVTYSIDRGTEDAGNPLSKAFDWDILSPAYLTADAAGDVSFLLTMPRSVYTYGFGVQPFGYGGFGGYMPESRDFSAIVLGASRHDTAGVRSVPQTLQVELDGPTLDLDFTTGVLDPRVTFTRTNNGTVIGSDGMQKTVGANVPRFDYDPITLQIKGLLVEAARTNYCMWSDAFDMWMYINANAVTVNSASSMSGAMTADTLNFMANAMSLYYTATALPSGYVTVSVFARVAAGTKKFRLATYNVTDGYFFSADFTADATYRRFDFTVAVTVANSNIYIVNGTDAVAGGLIVCGYQAEIGIGATSLIPTAGAVSSRAADMAYLSSAVMAQLFSQTEYTIVADFDSGGGAPGILNAWIADLIFSGSISNRAAIYSAAPGGYAGLYVVSAFTQQAHLIGGYYKYAQSKMAARVRANDFAFSMNGSAVIKNVTGITPAIGPPTLYIGTGVDAGGLNGHLRRLRIYDRALSDAELQAISGNIDALAEINESAAAWPENASVIRTFAKTAAKNVRVTMRGFTPGQQVVVPELFLGDVINMPYLELGYDHYPEVSQGASFTAESGREYPQLRYRRLEISPKWTLIGTGLWAAIEDLRETTLEMREPLWYAWAPDSAPTECYLMRNKPATAHFTYATPRHKNFSLDLVEAI